MKRTVSTYEAKARLSQLLKKVKEGDVVTITHRGEPVAELRRVEQRKESLEERLERLRQEGLVSRPTGKSVFKPLARRPGALRRFLKSRE